MLIKHSLYYLIGRIFPGLVGLISISVYTRILDLKEYGYYSLIIATSSIINSVLFQWLGISVTRFWNKYQKKENELLSTAIRLFKLIIIFTLFIFLIAIIFFHNFLNLKYIIIILLLTIGQAWYDFNLRIINIRLDPRKYGVLNTYRSIISFSCGLILYYFGYGLYGILSGIIIAYIIFTLINYNIWNGIKNISQNKSIEKEIANYGWPLTFIFGFTLIIDISDRYMLEYYLNSEAVGNYSASYDLTQQSLGALMSVVNLAAFPLALKIFESSGLEEAKKQIQKNMTLLLFIATPAVVGIFILSSSIANTMLGSAYREMGSSVIKIIGLAIYIGGLKSYYYDYSFQIMRKTKWQLKILISGAIVNIVINTILIPKLGVIGAAYSTLFSFIFTLILSIYYGQKLFKLPSLSNESKKILVASFLMGIIIFIFDYLYKESYLILKIALGILMYFILIYKLKIYKLSDYINN